MRREYTAIAPIPAAWDTFVAAHEQAHVLQTPAWGVLKSAFGWSAERVALIDGNGAIVAGAQLLFRPLPLRLGTMAYIPKGPLAPSEWWEQPERLAPLWEAIHAAARRHSARWLKVEAPDAIGMPDQASVWEGAAQSALRAAGCRPAVHTIQPPRTIVLDLAPDEATILARMKQKTRYNIRLSEKKEVVVRRGTPADLPGFGDMMAITGARDGFGTHTPAYYAQAYSLFAPSGRAALFLASYGGRDLAGIMAFALGRAAWYLFGASTNEERNRMPTYAAQWAAIQWARERGCAVYDLWGVPDEDEAALEAQFESRSDGLWGVYRTKRGWGGQVVRRMPAWDYCYSPAVYTLYAQYSRLRERDSHAR